MERKGEVKRGGGGGVEEKGKSEREKFIPLVCPNSYTYFCKHHGDGIHRVTNMQKAWTQVTYS